MVCVCGRGRDSSRVTRLHKCYECAAQSLCVSLSLCFPLSLPPITAVRYRSHMAVTLRHHPSEWHHVQVRTKQYMHVQVHFVHHMHRGDHVPSCTVHHTYHS